MGIIKKAIGLIRHDLNLRLERYGKELRKREYEIARNGRITAGYPKSQAPVNNEVRQGLVPSRTAAWHLVQNNSLGARYKNLCVKNIAGPYGFTLDMKCQVWKGGKPFYNADGEIEIDTLASKKIMNWWADWCLKRNCDVSEDKSFRRITNQVIVYLAVQGEYLVRKVYDGSKHGMRLLVMNPSYIDETYNVMLDNGNAVIMGVEYDSNFKRVALWIKKNTNIASVYASMATGVRERLPIEQVYYDFDSDMAQSARGMSPMTPSMLRAMLLWDYEKAAASNAVAEARQFGTLEKSEEATGDFNGSSEDESGNQIMDIEDMEVFQLDPGWKLNKPDSKYPSDQYEMFTKITTKFIASGWDLSYITLANDLTETSYGSGRIGLLDEQEGWKLKQEFVIESWHDVVFADALEASIMKGSIDLGRNAISEFDRFNHPYFHGKKFEWIAPDKDAQTIETKLRLGLTSPIREAAKDGNNFQELIDEQAVALEYAKSKGVALDFGGKGNGVKTGTGSGVQLPPSGK